MDGGRTVDEGVSQPDLGPDEPDLGPVEPDLGPPDLGPPDLGPPDLGPPDLGPDLGPQPECSLDGPDPACDDGDECTDDICADEMCANPNPSATCDRFAQLPCAETAVETALTQTLSFCLPAFSTPEVPLQNLPPGVGMPDLMIPALAVCEGETCDDGSAGCELTFTTRVDDVRYIEPPEEALEFDTGFSELPEVRMAGAFDVGDLSFNVDCLVGIDLGGDAGVFAEISLERPPMCSSDRPVDPSIMVGAMNPRLTFRAPSGADVFARLACDALQAFAAPIVDLSIVTDQLFPLLDGALSLALTGLDCGDCNDECLGGLVCDIGLPQ